MTGPMASHHWHQAGPNRSLSGPGGKSHSSDRNAGNEELRDFSIFLDRILGVKCQHFLL